MTIDARLTREASGNVVVPWLLVDDPSNAATGLSDPVVDQGVRDALAGELQTVQLAQLVPEKYDHVSLLYTGSDLTGVTYRQGGAGGAVVATLALAYSAGVLQSVGRT